MPRRRRIDCGALPWPFSEFLAAVEREDRRPFPRHVRGGESHDRIRLSQGLVVEATPDAPAVRAAPPDVPGPPAQPPVRVGLGDDAAHPHRSPQT